MYLLANYNFRDFGQVWENFGVTALNDYFNISKDRLIQKK